MIDRLDTRREIARRKAVAAEQREQVNQMPDVIASREAAEQARHAANEAEIAFTKVFRSHYPNDDDINDALIEDHPDLVVLGDRGDSLSYWIAFCAVTGLPLFEGDRVIETSTPDATDGERRFVLAAAVTVDPALLGPLARTGTLGSDGELLDDSADEAA